MAAVKEMVKDKAIEKAAERIDALAGRAKDALYDLAQGARDVGEIKDGAWKVAERAYGQAGEIAGDLYTRGQQTAALVGRSVEEQPWLALGVVGLCGFMLGYALRR
jgi:ElaB/YqjD/DUF883 family membrane-anchored ribosome-binding protein